MNAMKKMNDPREETYEVARQLDARNIAMVGLDVGPGDVMAFPECRLDGVEWLMVEEREAFGHFVALSDAMQAGPLDLALPFEALGGDAVVHCDVDAWLGAEQLEQAIRTARLSEVDLARVRRKLRDVENGNVTATLLEEEADSSFEYQEWIQALKDERDALVGRAFPRPVETVATSPSEPATVLSPAASKGRWFQWLALAATLVLAVGLGWQTQQLQHSLDAERGQIQQITEERAAERGEFEASLAEAERREAEARALSEQAESENASKEERIAELETSLRDALERRIRYNIPDLEFTWDGRTRRFGDPLVYRFEEGQTSAILSLAVVDPEPYDSYRLRIYSEDGKILYENDQMQKQNGQWLRLDLPAHFLPAGKYFLTVHGVRGGKFTEIPDAADSMRLIYPE